MKKKRLIAVLLCLAMILSLAGCGGNDSGENNTGSNAAEQTGGETTSTNDGGEEYTGPTGEISFCTWGSDAEIAMDQELCDAFMASHPGTTVTLEVFNDSYGTTVETRFLGGQSPDVIYGHPQTLLKWMQEGMLMDLTDLYEENDYLWDEEHYATELYDAFMMDDKYFATMNGADAFVLFYNKTMIEEAGLECPDEDTTWDELIDLATALTTYDEEGNILTVGMDSSYYYYSSFPIIYAFGGSVLDNMIEPTKVTINSPETVEAFRFLQEATNTYGFMPDDNDYTFLGAGFTGGQTAMFISGVYDIVWMTAIEDFEWDICMLPGAMDHEDSVALLYAGYGVSSQSKNPELAKEFALWLMGEEAQKILASTGLITTVNKDVAYSDEVLDIPGAPEHHSLRVDSLPYGVNLQGQLLCWEEMMTIYSNYLDQLYYNTITPEDCAAAIQAEWEVLLAEELADRAE